MAAAAGRRRRGGAALARLLLGAAQLRAGLAADAPLACVGRGSGEGGGSGGGRSVTEDGRVSLVAPLLCSSYACRAALVGQQHAAAGTLALEEHLLHCALPETPGTYELLEFRVTGLDAGKEDKWLSWVRQALEELGATQDCVKGATWYPAGQDVRFLVTTLRSVNATGVVTSAALGSVLDQLARPDWAVLEGREVAVQSLVGSPISVAETPGDVARTRLALLAGAAAALVGYLALAWLAHHSGHVWLGHLVLCWPELCDGGGCPLYRLLCAPLVLVYNALRIYACSCCLAFLARAGRAPFCRGCWREFTDPDFPPDDRAIGHVKGDTASGVTNSGGVAWAKASAIAAEQGGRPAHLFEGSIEPADVLQGALGDCWLMAALACVAERPEILEQAIVSKHVDPRGKYTFRLWNQVRGSAGTKWLDVVVDENIPVHPGTLRPKFARTHCNEMWVLLIEKAFAKMYGGYDRLDGGQMSWALTAITGNPALTFRKPKLDGPWACGKHAVDDDQLFRLLMRSRRNGAFLCCAMIAQADTKGLVNGHAYSIIQVVQVHTSAFSTSFFRMVQIRNPHGQTEWQGTWSDRDENWARYPHVAHELCGRSEQREDGTFWMQWEDFTRFWKEVQIVDCETNIRTVVPPNFNETACGPLWACVVGCCDYWLCCLGMRRLYFGRQPAGTLEALEEGLERRVGFDQEGCFCDMCDVHAAAADEHEPHGLARGGAGASDDELAPLCGWRATCGGHARSDSRVVSRSRD